MATYRQFDKSHLIGIKTQTVYFDRGEREEGSMKTSQNLGKD